MSANIPQLLRHTPALIVMLTTTIGGLWPMFDAQAAMLEFGFPPRIASSRDIAAPVMVHAASRTSVLGFITVLFYLRGKYAEVDTILALWGGYAGLVDTYQVWTLGEGSKKRWAVFRLVASWAIAAAGLAGWTSS